MHDITSSAKSIRGCENKATMWWMLSSLSFIDRRESYWWGWSEMLTRRSAAWLCIQWVNTWKQLKMPGLQPGSAFNELIHGNSLECHSWLPLTTSAPGPGRSVLENLNHSPFPTGFISWYNWRRWPLKVFWLGYYLKNSHYIPISSRYLVHPQFIFIQCLFCARRLCYLRV